MKPERPDKKSEIVKFRVPWSLKRDFMAKARLEGRSASDIFRDLAEDYLQRPAQRTTTQTLETAMTAIRKRPRMSFAAVLGAAGVSAVLASSIPAGAAPDLRAAFARMDTNGDGVVTMEEIRGGDGRTQTGNFELERREGPPPDDAADNAEYETFGPILIPVEIDGERRSMMVHFTRSSSTRELVTATNAPPAPVMAEFEAGDADGDGALSFDEFEERYIAMRANSFALLDTDSDGVLTEAEMTANPLDGPDGEGIANALRGIDSNGDGRVTRAEYEDAV